MDFAEFLEPYDRELKASYLEATPETHETVYGARFWAQRFGHIVHDYLSGEERKAEDVEHILDAGHTSYAMWVNKWLRPFRKQLEPSKDDADLRLDNELNFHTLAAAMLPAWLPLIVDTEDAPEQILRQNVTIAQDMLAFAALDHYLKRQQTMGPQADYDYYSPDNIERRRTAEGKACEYDAGIALMEVVRRNPGLIVVPAPPQFEKLSRRSEDGTSNNVDFVAIRQKQAVGIQVKTHVDDKTRAEYDTERVIFIDGKEDLKATRYVRLSYKNTTPREVAWSGLLSAQRVLKIKSQGPNAFVSNKVPKEMIRAKFIAKQLVGNTRSYFDDAVEVVESRLMTALQDPVQEANDETE
jgi:hypothetical protein